MLTFASRFFNSTKECSEIYELAPVLNPGTIKEACLSSLRSGHSHEDVDQAFGRLASFLVKRGHSCETPDDFQQVIKQFLQESVFPHEPLSNRYCVKLDQTRDWSFGIAHEHFSLLVFVQTPSILWTAGDHGRSKFGSVSQESIPCPSSAHPLERHRWAWCAT